MNGRGFLGTEASLASDLSLVLGILVLLALTVGVVLARRRRFGAHRRVQSGAVALNVLQVLVVMVGSYARSAAPGIPARLGESYFAVAAGHALLGLVTLLLGVFVAVRANELLPAPLHALRFHHFKPVMRTAYGLYVLSTLAGVAVYLTWYTGPPPVGPEPQPVAAANEVVIPMSGFAFVPPDVSVPRGATVVWINQDRAPHTATADNGTAFGTDLLGSGQSFRLNASEPGDFTYFCELHGAAGGVGMAGRLRVVEPGEAPLASAAPPLVPTLAPAAVPTGAPTPPPAPTVAAQPTLAAPEPRGFVSWRDDLDRNDAVRVTVDNLPPLSGGDVYAAWLAGPHGTRFIGTLGASGSGAHTLTYTAPDQDNLLAEFDRLSVAVVGAPPSDQPVTEPLLTANLPAQSLVHIRHVLVAIPATPEGIGFGLGLRHEAEELLRHAQFLRDALAENKLADEKLHAEHLVNLIEGANSDRYGDLNGNGRIDNPGDGFGVLENGSQDGYVKGTRDHARLAATSPDATDDIRLHAGHVQIAADNTRERTTDIRDRALAVLESRTVAATRSDVQRILALAVQTIEGVDLNGDEQVAPVAGEGGVTVAYQHAQLMAGLTLARATEARAPSATAAPIDAPPVALAPTNAPLHTHTTSSTGASDAAAQPIRVSVLDNSYGPRSLGVPLGATVLWTHEGQRPHTITADDGAYDSDLLRAGDSYQHTYSEVGTYLYYCELHGGPGGQGMAAEVTVN